MEQILSGYCRTIDASRMVLVEDGEADCDYECCAYRDVCQIGQEIARLCASSTCSSAGAGAASGCSGPLWCSTECPTSYSLRSLYSCVLPAFQFCTGR